MGCDALKIIDGTSTAFDGNNNGMSVPLKQEKRNKVKVLRPDLVMHVQYRYICNAGV